MVQTVSRALTLGWAILNYKMVGVSGRLSEVGDAHSADPGTILKEATW